MLRSRLPSVSAGGDYGKGLFNREMGPLQNQLCHGEYDLLKFAPMLESDFVQINKRGEVIDVHNQVQTVTVGVACTSPSLLVPNVLLLACPLYPPEEPPTKLKAFSLPRPPAKRYELTRLLPLCLVRISVHNPEKKQLRFKLASGRTFYLQLCPQPGKQEDVFGLWVKVANMLRPPLASIPVKDSGRREKALVKVSQPPGEALILEEKVSIQSIYSASESSTFVNEDVMSKESLILVMESPLCSPLPGWTPVANEEKAFDFDSYQPSEEMGLPEPFERPPSRRTHGSGKERDESSSSSPRRTSKTGRSRRKKSTQKGSGRKSSRILSLLRSCAWGKQPKSKSRSREKKR